MVAAPVARLAGLGHRYGTVAALEAVSLDLPGGAMVGLIGPDGVGKSTLLGIVAGSRRIQDGVVEVLGVAASGRADYFRFAQRHFEWECARRT